MTCSDSFVAYASVIPELAIAKPLDYGIPKEMQDKIRPGVQVEVPIRGHLRKGYVFAIKEKPEFTPVKSVASVTSSMELLTQDLFALALWMSTYYMAPLHAVFKALLPSSVRKRTKPKEQFFVRRNKTREELKQAALELRSKHPAQADVLDAMLKVKKGLFLTQLLEEVKCTKSPVNTLCKKGVLCMDLMRIDRSPLLNAEYLQTKPKKLGKEQAQALQKIVKDLDQKQFATHLLFGVTGSGKTEVYLQAIDYTLQQGRSVIMLVPEISLTQQTIERFRSRFVEKIAILHHRLSHGERYDEWESIREGKARIVIGARSALFSPADNLGLIIVDEEHESSYKQAEEMPTYNARDVAVMRGKLTKACVILGSATPSLESYYNAKCGKYTLSTLHTRADSAKMPAVRIVDRKKEWEKGHSHFSEELLNGIEKRCKKGEQTLLFLNRRGYHTMLFCPECKKSVPCPHCDTSLTFHHKERALACHLCGYTLAPPPDRCLACKAPSPMKFRGVGTEQVERALHAIFPDIRSIRLDADTTRHKGSHQKLLRDFATGKADVLIGTQMIAKGLHFSEVTLVGVLNSDTSLNIPDFRSSESVFQLITQVAGRSGRGALPGEVIIQTLMPENSTIQHAARQDFEGFYADEIAIRKHFGFPPFTRMVKLTFSGKSENATQKTALTFREKLNLPKSFAIHPVVPAGYAKVKDNFRFQLLIRGPAISPITKAIQEVKDSFFIPAQIKVLIDVNPTSTYM